MESVETLDKKIMAALQGIFGVLQKEDKVALKRLLVTKKFQEYWSPPLTIPGYCSANKRRRRHKKSNTRGVYFHNGRGEEISSLPLTGALFCHFREPFDEESCDYTLQLNIIFDAHDAILKAEDSTSEAQHAKHGTCHITPKIISSTCAQLFYVEHNQTVWREDDCAHLTYDSWARRMQQRSDIASSKEQLERLILEYYILSKNPDADMDKLLTLSEKKQREGLVQLYKKSARVQHATQERFSLASGLSTFEECVLHVASKHTRCSCRDNAKAQQCSAWLFCAPAAVIKNPYFKYARYFWTHMQDQDRLAFLATYVRKFYVQLTDDLVPLLRYGFSWKKGLAAAHITNGDDTLLVDADALCLALSIDEHAYFLESYVSLQLERPRATRTYADFPKLQALQQSWVVLRKVFLDLVCWELLRVTRICWDRHLALEDQSWMHPVARKKKPHSSSICKKKKKKAVVAIMSKNRRRREKRNHAAKSPSISVDIAPTPNYYTALVDTRKSDSFLDDEIAAFERTLNTAATAFNASGRKRITLSDDIRSVLIAAALNP